MSLSDQCKIVHGVLKRTISKNVRIFVQSAMGGEGWLHFVKICYKLINNPVDSVIHTISWGMKVYGLPRNHCICIYPLHVTRSMSYMYIPPACDTYHVLYAYTPCMWHVPCPICIYPLHVTRTMSYMYIPPACDTFHVLYVYTHLHVTRSMSYMYIPPACDTYHVLYVYTPCMWHVPCPICIYPLHVTRTFHVLWRHVSMIYDNHMK